MPNRPSHLPNYRERAALQMLRWKETEHERKFGSVAGPHLIETMIRKGWIVRLPGPPAQLAITDAGKMAFEAPI